MGQGIQNHVSTNINNYTLNAVSEFTYLGSTISSSLSIDTEINRRNGMASATLERLSERVWNNPKLSENTKIAVYNTYLIITLLYGGESWTPYSTQENRLNAFHMFCPRRILGISWRDKITSTEVLSRAKTASLVTTFRKCRLHWLGHARLLEEGRQLPEDILYRELASRKRSTGRPLFVFTDVCKRDMKACSIDFN